MELRKIRYASVLAQEGNYARAASKLHITQGALSQSILRLEEEIGFALFDRTRWGTTLTSAGKDFIDRAQELLIAERTLAHEAKLVRDGQIGRITFGLSPISANIFLRSILLDLASEKSLLHTQVELGSSADLLDHLIQERIDFFVADAVNIKPNRKTSIRKLGRLHVGFYARAGHPVTSLPAPTLGDLSNYRVLSTRLTDVSSPRFRSWLGLVDSDNMPITMMCDDIAALKYLALNSDAILLAAYETVKSELARGALVELQLSDLQYPGSTSLSVISLANRTLAPSAAIIIGRMAKYLADHAPDKV